MRFATAIFVVFTAGLFTADDTKKDDAELMKGKWKAVSMSIGGEPAPEEFVKDFKLNFDAKTYTNTTSGDMVEEGEYAIDATKSPKTIDFDIKKGPDEGKKQLGLYKLDGDKLTIVVATAGSKDRPTSLKVEKGTDAVEFVLERSQVNRRSRLTTAIPSPALRRLPADNSPAMANYPPSVSIAEAGARHNQFDCKILELYSPWYEYC